MKNSFNLGFVVLLFVVLGCSCPKLDEITKQINSTSNTSNSNSTNSNSTSIDSTPSNKSSSAKTTLSLEKYNRIKDGMSYQEVSDILGGEGVEQMSSGTGKYKVTSYKWEASEYQFVTVIFMGDKENSKVQYGLK